MATVRVSDKLIGQVVENVSTLYRKRFTEIENQKPDFGDRLYDLLYGPYLADMERLPEGFLRKVSRLETKTVGGKAHSIYFPLSGNRRAAWTHPHGAHVTVSDTSDKVDILRTPQTEEIVDTILAWRQQSSDLAEVREAGQKAVRRVMKNYVSLPPIIKMFPPIVDLLPPEVKRKIEVPQHRLSSVAMELDPVLKRLATDIAVDKLLNR